MADTTATVLLCRGCCCGKDDDAGTRADRLLEAVGARPGACLRLTNCLGPCERSDVVAVRHRRLGAPGRHGTTWLERTDDSAALGALADWVRAGAAQPVPTALAPLVFDPVEIPVTPDHEVTPSGAS